MPDFDTRRPRQQEKPSQLRIASITNKIRTMLVAAKLRGALIASKLRTTLLASRLRILLIGGGIYLFVVAVPVGLLIYSPSWLGNQQQKVVDKASNDDNPLVACAADRGSQQSFVLSYQNDLWTMSLNGSNLIPVIYTASASIHGGPVSEYEPTWSPDRTRIAFIRSQYGAASGSAGPESQSAIYVMNHDGSCQTKVVANAHGPTWSPDGKKIAFSKTRPGLLNSIYIMNAAGSGEPKRLTTKHLADDADPAWSPDGKKMAFVRDRYIYIIDCCEDEEGSTNEAKRLTDGPERDREPVWSPDGTELAFTRVDIGKVGGGGVDLRNTDVYKINVDGSSETRLTHTYSSKYPEHNAVWSPSGDHLAFIRGSYQVTDDVSSNTIYLMKSDGSQPTVVRWVPDAAGMDFDWR